MLLADSIRERILSGELQPGSRVPTDSELRDRYGVGKSTIREAIRLLTSQDLVQITRGVTGGTFVSTPSINHISAHIETGVALLTATSAVTVDQLMDVRRLIEVPAAGAAAYRRTDEQLQALKAATFDPPDIPQADTFAANENFHLTLLRAANNPLIELAVAPVFRVLDSRFRRDLAPDDFLICVAEDHRALLEAFEDRDSMRITELMARHLQDLTAAYKAMDVRRRK